MAGGISASNLLGWYSSFFGGSGTNPTGLTLSTGSPGAATTTPAPVLYAPTPPWQQTAQPSQSQLVKTALGGAQLFNPSAAQLNLPGASADYKNLFALYSGLSSLYAIATQAAGSNVSSLQLSQLSSAFSNGMTQLSQYLGATSYSKLKLTAGVTATSETSAVSTPAQATSYTTTALNTTGNSNSVAPAFEGNVSFSITAQLGTETPNVVPIDLANMGSTPRTIGNVVNYINSQLKAAGVFASFQAQSIAATPDTFTVNGKTVTVSSGQQSWALQLRTNPVESITLSAPLTGPAVYVGQVVGNTSSSTNAQGETVPPDAQSQLLKFNASGDAVTSPTPPAYASPDQLSTTGLGGSVNSIQATAVAPDGSVYVLSNVNATTGGGTPAGGQDVALQKYDAAGHQIFSTDLGSVSSASGLSLAVSADGAQVAVAGQVTGSLTAGNAVSDPTGANSFVTVFDKQGDQVWTQQQDLLTPNQANAVAFGANGNVYVTGQAQAQTGVQPASAPSSSYLQVYSSTGAPLANTQIASGGPNTSNGVAVDGSNVYVAGVQNGNAVVSEYDVSNPQAPTLVATRNLGALQGGKIAGVAVESGTVYVAGTTANGSLSAGTVTSAASGSGQNAFAATLSTGLQPAGSDAIAYYGGSGNTNATAMTVANGQVWLTGSVTGSLPGEPAIGANDGYVAALNVGTGAVTYAQRFTGQDGKVAPTSIAVDPTGASILDQLGLPAGVVDGPVSNLVTATTPVQAGDSFGISVNGAPPVSVTVKSTDTMASLATEIARATGFSVSASTGFGPNGSTTLQISPSYPGVTINLVDGPSASDALAAFGLKPGLVADTSSKNGVTVISGSGTPVYGLGLPASLDLSSKADIKTAQVQLAGAISVVQNAYKNLSNAATPAAVLALQKAQATGGMPSYISSEIANYQSALARLTGSTSTTTGLSSLFTRA